MKAFFKTKWGKCCIALLVLALLGGAGAGGYAGWLYQQPKFHDMTIELGSQLPATDQFLTEYANPEKVQLVTPVAEIDLALVGQQQLTFQHGRKQETVNLTIQDTTAPVLKLREVHADIKEVLTPGDFVEETSDLSGCVVAFAEPLAKPESYGEAAAQIMAKDAYGNTTVGESRIFYVWMKDTYTLELGDQLKKSDLLMNPEQDADLLDQRMLDRVNLEGVGTHVVVSRDGDLACQCTVTVQDTTPPELELKKVEVYLNGYASKKSFIASVSDASGEITTRLLTKLTFDSFGTQTVVIEAEDAYGNVTTKKTTLSVVRDTTPPTFSGMTNMKVEKNSAPDFGSGVAAYDNKDGRVSFTYDASAVDLTKAGVYFVTYYAVDEAGNTGTGRRKVEVNHDAADTTALVNSIAATLPANAEAIRDYVRNTIAYNTNWGGKDPVWYGFTNKVGNCYVHALCLQRLLSAKGFATQLIWTTCRTHYWLIVNIGGTWYHIDATPVGKHTTYSLMTDDMRYATLSGRNWDRTAWPVCG